MEHKRPVQKRWKHKRKHMRFDPDPNSLCLISFTENIELFDPELIALVFNESYSGCGVVMLADERMKEGMICVVKTGDMHPMRASLRWINALDANTLKLGFEYLEQV